MTEPLPLIALENAQLAADGRTLVCPINFELRGGEIWQIHGPAGSGKSLLLELLFGRHRLTEGRRSYPAFIAEFPDARIGVAPRFALRLVSQAEQRHLAADLASFYQARWHSLWTEPMTVDEFLTPARVMGLRPYEVYDGLLVRRDFEVERERCLVEMALQAHRSQAVAQLSNGELRKLLLISAHLASPSVMLLDDPLGGIDPEARQLVSTSIRRWCEAGQTLVFCMAHDDLLSDLATRHLTLVRDENEQRSMVPPAMSEALEEAASTVPSTPPTRGPILRCHQLRVAAGASLLLDGVDWQIQHGEHWMISGPNGAGKSTLLALLTGDHPQAYSNDVELLGGRLGHGTTLWQRKRTIGFVAPELGWHYPAGWRLWDVVLSGFDGSVGSFREPTVAESAGAKAWLKHFGLFERKDEPLASLSEGQRRLTLLARAMVHGPRLLLLDEPTQDLSARERQVLFEYLDGLALRGDTTVVLVTHYLTEHPRCITHHLALERGRVVRSGPLS